MSEAKFESIARQLRKAAPTAPEGLRERVRALREPQAGRTWRLRPALAAAVAIVVAVGVSAATIGGLTGSTPEQKSVVELRGVTGSASRARSPELRPVLPTSGRAFSLSADANKLSALPPGSRLQHYDVSMRLRVRDLSRATQAAVREARRLGGYVAAADYSTGNNVGDSSLQLRVPVGRLQQAIARFTDLGTILSQHIVVADLKAPLDRTDARIAALQKVIAELEAKSFLTPAEQAKLDGAKRTVQRLSQSRTRIIRAGSFAKIALQLTTRKAAAQHTQPGRFGRFWGDAGDILGKEAIGVLYALVVAGPFAILAVLALLAERARRRRANHRLLGETG
jgi:hypothetical protein